MFNKMDRFLYWFGITTTTIILQLSLIINSIIIIIVTVIMKTYYGHGFVSILDAISSSQFRSGDFEGGPVI